MYPALLILLLLVLAASLGSWLFSQWLSERRRTSALALGVGGMGFVLLLGATAVAIVSTSANWQVLVPWVEKKVQETVVPAKPVPVTDLGSAEQWPATACIKPAHATATVPRRWFLDNDCDRPIVVLLAWCDEAHAVCAAGAPQAAWRYEPNGLILISALARPISRRMPERDAPIAGTFALTEPQGGAFRIRYLACFLSAPAAEALTLDSLTDQEFQKTVRADDCYSRVVSASLVAARSGQPPVVSIP